LENKKFLAFKSLILKIDLAGNPFGKFMDTILDVLYPQELDCAVCGNKLKEGAMNGICAFCINILPLINSNYCKRCGKPENNSGESCVECDGIQYYFDQALSVFEYSSAVQRLIFRFKYRNETQLSRVLGNFMAQRLREQKDWRYDAIVPVPLHRKRQSERGFNQALLLTSAISQIVDVPVVENTLFRTKQTPVQAGLGRHERFANMKHAFSVSNNTRIKGKNIVLVDDIYTTGSTTSDCSRALLDAGALKVYVLTLATGRPEGAR